MSEEAAPNTAVARQALKARRSVISVAAVSPLLAWLFAIVTSDGEIASPSTMKLCRSMSATTP